MKILIADDHSVVRQGVSLILREAFKDVHIEHSDTFSATLDLLNERTFDMVMLDINLPGGNSITMVQEVKKAARNIKILIFSAYEEEKYAIRYMQAGAHGYLNKLSDEDKIITAVKDILNGKSYVSEEISQLDFQGGKNPLLVLSGREFEIAELLVNGDGNLEIANKLNIRMSTVSTYKSRIFEKLNVDNVVTLSEIFKLYGS